MTQRDDGGSAFPSTPLGDDGKPGGAHRFGMSLRDYFAGQALSSIPLRSWDYLSAEGDKVRAWATLAYAVADAMLAARSPAPEGGETDPVAGARLVEIARIIEDVDNRCLAADGPVTKTRHEMTDDEMRAIYALAKHGPSASPDPDRIEMQYELAFYTKVLQEAKSALHAMLTFYGMDEDPAEMSGAVHKQARAAVARIQEALGGGDSPGIVETTRQSDHTELLPRIRECIEQLRDRLNEIDRWQNGERNSLPGFSQSVIFADRVLIDIQEALGDG